MAAKKFSLLGQGMDTLKYWSFPRFRNFTLWKKERKGTGGSILYPYDYLSWPLSLDHNNGIKNMKSYISGMEECKIVA